MLMMLRYMERTGAPLTGALSAQLGASFVLEPQPAGLCRKALNNRPPCHVLSRKISDRKLKDLPHPPWRLPTDLPGALALFGHSPPKASETYWRTHAARNNKGPSANSSSSEDIATNGMFCGASQPLVLNRNTQCGCKLRSHTSWSFSSSVFDAFDATLHSASESSILWDSEARS